MVVRKVHGYGEWFNRESGEIEGSCVGQGRRHLRERCDVGKEVCTPVPLGR
jgi:hypothetical protein